jgi:hypothetical protein
VSEVRRPTLVVGVHLTDDGDALRRSLPTVVHQQVDADLCVVVVDDDASDGARSALDQLASWYDDVEVRRAPRRAGRAAARDEVLGAAPTGSLVAWLDLGDVWHPRKLATQLTAWLGATDPDRTVVTTSHRVVEDADERVLTPQVAGDPQRALLDRDLDAPGGTLLAPADLLRRVGGVDRELAYRDDEELLFRVLVAGGHLVVAPGGPLSTGPAVRDHPSATEVAHAARRLRRFHGRRARAIDPLRASLAHRRELQRAAALHAKAGDRRRAFLAARRADLATLVARAARLHLRREPAAAAPSRPGPTRPEPARDSATSPSSPTRPPDPVPTPALAPVREAAERDDWATAIAAWESAPADARDAADPVSVELVARALRATGRHADAIVVTTAALARSPGHPRVELELAKSRAATTDWSRAWSPATPVSSPPPGPGAVTDLGVLVGGTGVVRGQLGPAVPHPAEVTLHLGTLPVVTSWTGPDGGFSLSCEQLLEFVGDGDVLRVTVDGAPLALPGLGDAAVAWPGHPSRVEALRARLEGGAVFTKFGQLRPGYTPARVRRTLDLVDEVAAVATAVTGELCTPFYGNLLGAIREQGLIAHDVGGFDVGYVSRHREPEAVRAEVVEVGRRLLDAGYHLELERFGVMVRREPRDRIFVDLNFGWSTAAGTVGLAFGWRHDPPARVDRFRAPRTTYLAGRLVPVPGDAEAVLHQVYGPGWAVPDQGFELSRELRRDAAYLLTDADRLALADHAPDRVRLLGE